MYTVKKSNSKNQNVSKLQNVCLKRRHSGGQSPLRTNVGLVLHDLHDIIDQAGRTNRSTSPRALDDERRLGGVMHRRVGLGRFAAQVHVGDPRGERRKGAGSIERKRLVRWCLLKKKRRDQTKKATNEEKQKRTKRNETKRNEKSRGGELAKKSV